MGGHCRFRNGYEYDTVLTTFPRVSSCGNLTWICWAFLGGGGGGWNGF